jgi:lysozyme family protein
MALSEQDRFKRCLREVLKHEGGYVDHPRDPGGHTNLGVTLATARAHDLDMDGDGDVDKIDVRALKPEDVEPVYRASYWLKAKCDKLQPGVDLMVFDLAVNSGPGRAAKFLQECVGVPADGAIGPITLAAVNRLPARELCVRLRNRRDRFYRSLSTFDAFGRGWMRRLNEVSDLAFQWAGTGL